MLAKQRLYMNYLIADGFFTFILVTSPQELQKSTSSSEPPSPVLESKDCKLDIPPKLCGGYQKYFL